MLLRDRACAGLRLLLLPLDLTGLLLTLLALTGLLLGLLLCSDLPELRLMLLLFSLTGLLLRLIRVGAFSRLPRPYRASTYTSAVNFNWAFGFASHSLANRTYTNISSRTPNTSRWTSANASLSLPSLHHLGCGLRRQGGGEEKPFGCGLRKGYKGSGAFAAFLTTTSSAALTVASPDPRASSSSSKKV
ncbi:hypothetical protein C4D60_Mb09t24910 [Musa balbisiana]|uniref:Uncharacterized protein n=1 Tax=Musa balbisiana TaxID=52838 RepID=A0A4S8ILB5_MUSBA|nr:hypothetical protein C4D60_Mb09t24910 [Musa balbisiana]